MPRNPLPRRMPSVSRLPVRARKLLPAALGLLALVTPLMPARADQVITRVARSRQLVVTGTIATPPMLSIGSNGQPEGYAMVFVEQVQGELSRALGKPVTVRFLPANSNAEVAQAIGTGKADLACGVPFSWDQDQHLDYSLPIALSSLRLLAPKGRLDGSPASLRGRRIGAVSDSLALSELKGMQPAAIPVTFPSLSAAVSALTAGSIDGVIGDSLLLRSLARSQGASGLSLSPEEPYESFAVTCALPENDSAFRNIVNLAIARLLQGYMDNNATAVSTIERWVGPNSDIALPSERIRSYFENVLLNVEAIRSEQPSGAPSTRN